MRIPADLHSVRHAENQIPEGWSSQCGRYKCDAHSLDLPSFMWCFRAHLLCSRRQRNESCFMFQVKEGAENSSRETLFWLWKELRTGVMRGEGGPTLGASNREYIPKTCQKTDLDLFLWTEWQLVHDEDLDSVRVRVLQFYHLQHQKRLVYRWKRIKVCAVNSEKMSAACVSSVRQVTVVLSQVRLLVLKKKPQCVVYVREFCLTQLWIGDKKW